MLRWATGPALVGGHWPVAGLLLEVFEKGVFDGPWETKAYLDGYRLEVHPHAGGVMLSLHGNDLDLHVDLPPAPLSPKALLHDSPALRLAPGELREIVLGNGRWRWGNPVG